MSKPLNPVLLPAVQCLSSLKALKPKINCVKFEFFSGLLRMPKLRHMFLKSIYAVHLHSI